MSILRATARRRASHARRLLALLASLVAVPACGASGPDDGTGDVFDDTGTTDDGGDDFPGDDFPGDDGSGDPDDGGELPMTACMVENVDRCSGDNVCVEDACVPAMGRSYTLSVSLKMALETPDGASWDQPYGDPDGYVQLTMDDTLVFEEYGEANSYEPPLVKTATRMIAAGTTLVADGYDHDSLSYDELIISCTKTLTAEDLRARMFSCTKDGSTITTKLMPQ
jgi:hypothetical protein